MDFFLNIIFIIKSQFLSRYIYDFSVLKFFEICITFTGILYIIFLAKQKPFAWILGMFDCTVLAFIWASKGVVGQTFLYIFYVVNGLYGFIKWSKKDFHDNSKYNLKVSTLGLKFNIILLLLLTILTTIIIIILNYLKNNNYIVSNYTIQDVTILVFSLYALFLQVNKKLENWLYWAIMDIMIFILYIRTELYFLSVIKSYFVFMSIYGFFLWKNEYKLLTKNEL